MKVTVKLFAVARDRAGAGEVEVELSPPATIGRLRSALAEQYPPLRDVVPHVRFAVNNEYSGDAIEITSPCEIAVIPPVSGG